MKRYSQHQIEALLDKFMDGLTTVEEEALLAGYFRTHDVPAEWEDYRLMFGYFDREMDGGLSSPQATGQPFLRWMDRRWWGIGAAAAITVAIVATAVLHHPESSSSVPETHQIASNERQELATPIGETQDFVSLQSGSTQPVETQNLASPPKKTPPKNVSRNRRLMARNDSLRRENERLQRELDDLRRRAFIIDMEANGYKAVIDESGGIVFIDMEQEIENEFNHQPTSNIPEI